MKAQRLVLWMGLGLAIASILYPPWARVSSRAEMFLGYAWIFDPPEYSVIALSHLAIQTALVGAAVGIAYLLSAGVEIRSSGIQRTATLGLKVLASFVVIVISLVPTTFFTTSRGPSGAWLVSTVILFGGLYAIWHKRKPAGERSNRHHTRSPSRTQRSD